MKTIEEHFNKHIPAVAQTRQRHCKMSSKWIAMRLEFAMAAVEANTAFEENYPHVGNIWATMKFGGSVNMRRAPTQVDIQGIIRNSLLRIIAKAAELNITLIRFDDPEKISNHLLDTLVAFGSCLEHHKNASTISPQGTMEDYVNTTIVENIVSCFTGSSSNHTYYHHCLDWKFIVNKDT